MENKKWYENMYMLNRDPDWDADWYWKNTHKDDSSAEACKKSIESIFGMYEHPLTDVALCMFCQTALYPTDKYLWGGKIFSLYRYRGEPAWRFKRLNMIYEDYHLDHVQIFIDQTRKNNIRPWASFRMNDCHPPSHPSAMYAEAVENGEVVGNEYGYYRYCFDFAYPKYRNALLDLIKEVFDKYDFFGLELDFMREPYCYDYKNNPDCHKMLTEYVREIKDIMLKAEKRLGHEIKILIRVPSTPSTAKEFGFDVKTLVDEGLVDAVSPCPRWEYSDSGIPVRAWQELVEYKVPIIPGIEDLNLKMITSTLEMAKGYLASFWGQGADGTYLYNFFFHKSLGIWDITKDNCLIGKRQFIVTDQDCFAYPENRYKPLPIALNGTAELPLEVGKLKATDTVKVIIDFEGEEFPTLSANEGEYISPVQVEPVVRTGWSFEDVTLTEHTPLAYDISGVETPSHLDLKFAGNGTVHYVEISIDAK